MRSWSKCVIFSLRTKSSRRAGPRSPTLSELWLSAIGWPKLVVRTWPVESTLTRSKESLDGFTPEEATVPVLSEAVFSVSVLAVADGSAGVTDFPCLGFVADAPNSLGLLGLVGNAEAVSSVACFCRTAGSRSGGAPFLAPPAVDFAADGFPRFLVVSRLAPEPVFAGPRPFLVAMISPSLRTSGDAPTSLASYPLVRPGPAPPVMRRWPT